MEPDEFASHPFWQELDRAKKALQGTRKDAGGSALTRLRESIAYMNSFRSDRGRLVSRPMLDAAYSQWQAVLGSILNSEATGEPAYLEQASLNLDPVLMEVGRWPKSAQRETSNDLRARLTEVLGMIEDRAAAMERDILTQEADWRSRLSGLAEELAKASGSASAQEDRLARLQIALDAQNQSIADTAARQLAEFSKQQAQQDADARARLDAINQESDTRLAEESSRFDEAGAKADVIVSSMRELLTKTEKLAGNTTSAVLARDYGAYSQREFGTGVTFILGGIVALAGAVVFLMMALGLIGPEQPTSWQWVTLKLSVTATAVGGASVLIAVGNRFLKNAAVNKRVELELRAIGPFLADLTDDAERQRAKIDFLDRTFGHAFDIEGATADADDMVNVPAMTKLVTSLMALANRAP